MTYRITSNLNDGLAEAPGVEENGDTELEVSVANIDGAISALAEGELPVGGTLLIERLS